MGRQIRNYFQSTAYWLGRRSMQSRLVAAYVFILLFPSIVVSNYLFGEIRDSHINETLRQGQYLVELEKVNILNQIEAMELAAQLTILSADITEYISTHKEFTTEELLDLYWGPLTDVIHIQTNNPNIAHLRLFADNDYISEMWPIVFHERRIQTEPWYSELAELDGKELWVFKEEDADILHRNVTDVHNQMPKVSLMRVVRAGSERIGVIQVEMLLKHFAPKAFASLQDEGSQMMLADSKGSIVLDELQAFAGKGSNPKLRTAIKEQFAAMKELGQQEIRFTVDDHPYLLIRTPVEQAEAELLHVISLESVYERVSKGQFRIMAVNVGLIGLLSIITYMMNAIILKNLRRLTDAMKKVRRGETPAGLPLSGGGEIGELAFHFNKMMQTINELIAQGVRKKALTKEAELRTLHSQIDSHFLYNTLENIKMLAEIENQRLISDSLTSLGGMMRYNFKWSGEYVRLQDEIRHIQNYIDVMNIRFDEPIVLERSMEPGLLEVEMLKMSLQPIVENALKHAWPELGEEQRLIQIAAFEQAEGGIVITLRDNGEGIAPEPLALLNERIQLERAGERLMDEYERSAKPLYGIGLRNVHQRIRIYYGKPYGLQVRSEEGQFTEVMLTLPKVLIAGGGDDD
ncbi:sensor histidine kinase [Paenibacillus sp. Leaf72]|uniref:sensor histidine kinase n=1 Tax=Paenibacillus sp. Leaf72 TaxID=1736234 RepID=UPI0006F3B1BD|nr:sensor histidine kinase [Paenibacillus sp. Leaf72]KQO18368.1 histidine kinase [Paenibacillus sp. Leaf72]